MAVERPRIGVSRWEDVPGERIEDYWDRIVESGGVAVDLNRGGTLQRLDGLILTGGYDVDPARYGEPRHPKVKYIDSARDAFEVGLLNEALERDLPVLAICRSSQLLNVAFGGKLLQHIDDHSHLADYRVEGYPSAWHRVQLAPGSRLRAIYGRNDIETNSRHHQAVLKGCVASGLRIAGWAPDGLIEAIESVDHTWVIGVQWHPERPEPQHATFAPESRALFAAFVTACRKVGLPA